MLATVCLTKGSFPRIIETSYQHINIFQKISPPVALLMVLSGHVEGNKAETNHICGFRHTVKSVISNFIQALSNTRNSLFRLGNDSAAALDLTFLIIILQLRTLPLRSMNRPLFHSHIAPQVVVLLRKRCASKQPNSNFLKEGQYYDLVG